MMRNEGVIQSYEANHLAGTPLDRGQAFFIHLLRYKKA